MTTIHFSKWNKLARCFASNKQRNDRMMWAAIDIYARVCVGATAINHEPLRLDSGNKKKNWIIQSVTQVTHKTTANPIRTALHQRCGLLKPYYYDCSTIVIMYALATRLIQSVWPLHKCIRNAQLNTDTEHCARYHRSVHHRTTERKIRRKKRNNSFEIFLCRFFWEEWRAEERERETRRNPAAANVPNGTC